jgi:hypothetical protein
MSTSFAFTPIVTDGLILYLDAANTKSYISGSTDWYDLTTYNNDGTLTNGPVFSDENEGNITFDGIDDYVNIPYDPIFDNQSFTLNIWVKFFNFGSFNSLITNPQNGTISSPWFNPYLSWMLRVISNNGVEVGIGSNSVYYNSNFSYNFTTNQIYNIVATYDGSTVTAYVNSIKIGQNSVSTTINYTSKPVIIGSDYGLGFSNCSIYNTQVYNRPLTDSEILQNYNATKWRFQ